MRIRIGFAFIFVTYAITLSSILGGCGVPFNKNWQINPDPGSKFRTLVSPYVLVRNINCQLPDHCQPAISHIDLFVTVILNVLTDAYLLSIPIPVR